MLYLRQMLVLEVPMPNKKFRTTRAQRQGLVRLQKSLGRKEYYIYFPPKKRAAHRRSFVALPQDNLRRLVLVQPNRKGGVDVRPFCGTRLYRKEREAMAEVRDKFKERGGRLSIRTGRLISPKNEELCPKDFLTRRDREELSFLVTPFQFSVFEKSRLE
jgi:hypothetical protein